MNLPANQSSDAQSKSVAIQSGRRGFEEPIDKSELIFPRARIFQGTPKEAEQFPDAKGGDIFNNLSSESLPEKFVPIFKFTNFIKFNPRDPKDENYDSNFEAGAVIWNITDPHDVRVKETEFGPYGEKPTAIRFMNFMCVFEGVESPIAVSFGKTSFKAGKKLYSMLTFSSGDMWDRKFKLSTKKVSNDLGTYFVYDVQPAGESTEEERSLSEQYYQEFGQRTKEIQIDQNDNVAWDEEATEA